MKIMALPFLPVEYPVFVPHGWTMYITVRLNDIRRFTVTSHDETRGRLLRLVGKTVKMAAIFVVFTL